MLDKSAIEKIESLSTKSQEFKDIDGVKYLNTGAIIAPPYLEQLDVANLTSLVAGVKILGLTPENAFIHIEGADRVSVKSIKTGITKKRDEILISDVAYLSDSFEDGKNYSQDEFIVKLQTCFEPTDDLIKLIDTISSVSIQDGSDIEDDGFSQTVTVKAGVTLKGRATLPNPILLKPFRTFPEIAADQKPVSYHLRITKTNASAVFKLTAQQSLVWDLNTMKEIKEWLDGETTLVVI